MILRSLLVLGVLFLKLTSASHFVCYYTNWAQYRPKAGILQPENIDASLCTHIIYAFAKVVEDRLEPYEWNDQDTPWSRGLYSKIIDLKAKNPQLKVLIGVGGWNHGPKNFSDMVHDNGLRRRFVQNSLEYLASNRFDGLDLDWEYPGSREGARPSDKQLFTILVRELKEAFKPYSYLLTAAVAAGKSNIDRAYEITEIAKYFDFITLMAYDFHGAWEQTVGLHSPLYPSKNVPHENFSLYNTDWAVNYWINNGYPRERLVLGLATYGRVFKLKESNKNRIYSLNDGPGVPGEFTREAGFLSYFEICKNLKKGWKQEWSDENKVPFAYNSEEWVGYENIISIKIKAQYIKEKKLAGAMFWAIDLDDFDGQFCNQGSYPLIKTVRNEILGLTANNQNYPTIDPSQQITGLNSGDNTQSQQQHKPSIINNFQISQNIVINQATPSSQLSSSSEQNTINNNQKPKPKPKPTKPNKNDQNYSQMYKPSKQQSTNQDASSNNNPNNKLFVCYYSNWAQYRPLHGVLMPEKIDPTICTHIIYAFAKVVDDRIEPYEKNDRDSGSAQGLYSKVVDLKKKNPQLKVLIGVGGWNHGPKNFSDMVHDDNKRANFIRNSISFLKENRFDGIDIDWEYPGSREGSRPTDKPLYTIFLQELSEALKPHNFLLSAAVAAGKSNIDNAYEIDQISSYLDFVNLMAYDFHGAWEQTVGHHSPLYPNKNVPHANYSLYNTDWAVNYWINNGYPRERLILGVATYGRVFKLKESNKNRIYSLNDGPGVPGEFTREAGFLSYFEICKNLKKGWKQEWSDENKVPFAYSANEWVGYENRMSLLLKAQYIKEKQLGGAMFWSLDLDDFSGKHCGEGQFPLIKTVRNELLSSSSSSSSSSSDQTQTDQTHSTNVMINKPMKNQPHHNHNHNPNQQTQSPYSNSNLNNLDSKQMNQNMNNLNNNQNNQSPMQPTHPHQQPPFSMLPGYPTPAQQENPLNQFPTPPLISNMPPSISTPLIPMPPNPSIISSPSRHQQPPPRKKLPLPPPPPSPPPIFFDDTTTSGYDNLMLINSEIPPEFMQPPFMPREHQSASTSSSSQSQSQSQSSKPDTKTGRMGMVIGRPFKCPRDGLFANHIKECRAFYSCVHTGTIHEQMVVMDCPANLFFDDATQRCEHYLSDSCLQIIN